MKKGGYGTFFLFKAGNEFFVAAAYFFSDGRGVRARSLSLERVFRARKRHRLVVNHRGMRWRAVLGRFSRPVSTSAFRVWSAKPPWIWWTLRIRRAHTPTIHVATLTRSTWSKAGPAFDRIASVFPVRYFARIMLRIHILLYFRPTLL